MKVFTLAWCNVESNMENHGLTLELVHILVLISFS